jgi:hypothetical protein
VRNLPERSSFKRAESTGVVVVGVADRATAEKMAAGVPMVATKLETERFYVFSPTQLDPKRASVLTYLGSERGYHLFRIYQKYTTDERLAYRIAFAEADCDVANPRPPAQERMANFTRRHAGIEEGRCVVEAGKGE